MTLHPKISVILTCFNQGKYLKDSLGSVIGQGWDNWECFVIDDGSLDDSLQIAHSFAATDPRIHVISQPNSGVSAARNKGISQVQGDLIQFLDGDDILKIGKWKKQVAIIQENPEIDLVYGPSRYFFDGKLDQLFPLHPNGAIPCDLTFRDSHQAEMIFRNNVCTNSALLMRRKVVESINFRMVIYEDWIFNLEAALKGFRFHFDSSHESLTLVRMTQNSQMMQHTHQLTKMEDFKKLRWDLVNETGFPLDLRFIPEKRNSLTCKFKKVIRSITPPLIYDWAAKLKNR